MSILDFIRKLPTLNEINGNIGEQMAKIFAKSFTDGLVLHDVLIDGREDGTSQLERNDSWHI